MHNANCAYTAFTVMKPASTYCAIVSAASKVPGRTYCLLSKAASIVHGKRSNEPIHKAILTRTKTQVCRRHVFRPRYSMRKIQRVFDSEKGARRRTELERLQYHLPPV
jgi:hypothetical protein